MAKLTNYTFLPKKKDIFKEVFKKVINYTTLDNILYYLLLYYSATAYALDIEMLL